MAYSRNYWVNDETELSAENFNKMELGITNSYPIQLTAVSEVEPASPSNNDKYYNITDNKIYKYVNNEWVDNGTPVEDIFYVVINENGNYVYNGTTLVSVGGGSAEVIISEEEPEDGKLWVNSGELSNLGSEVVNTLDGDETDKAPSVSAVNEALNGLIKTVEFSKEITVAGNSTAAGSMGTIPSYSGYTLLGYIPYSNGYGDQWLVTYGEYSNNVYYYAKSFYTNSLTGTIKCRAIFLKN